MQPTRPQVSAWSEPPINATSLHYPYLDRMAVVSEAIAQGQAGQVYLDNTWWRPYAAMGPWPCPGWTT